MRKLFLGLIVIVMMVCLINPGLSTAADKVKAIGEVTYGIDDSAQAQDVRRQNLRQAPGDLNYTREVYTADPPSGEAYPSRAASLFWVGDTVYLVDRYYMGNTGSYTKYWFITDMTGTVVYLGATDLYTSTTGFKYLTKAVTFYVSGSFLFHTLTLGPGEYISSYQFPFLVQ